MDVPVHHSTEATPRDRGYGLGVAQTERIAAVVDIYERLFQHTAQISPDEIRRLGASAMEVIQGWAPELGEEIEGIASGSGQDVATIAALNARTELLAAGRGECSTIACLGNATVDGEPIGIQTWDWHDDLAGCWMVWTIDH